MTEIFKTQEIIGIVTLCGLLAFQARHRAPLLLVAAWGYFLVNTARIAHVVRIRDGKHVIHVDPSAAMGLLLLILVPIVVWNLSEKHRRWLMAGFACVLFLNLIPLVMSAGHGGMASGIFGCESYDAAIMAAVLPIAVAPFVLQENHWRANTLIALSFLVPLTAAIVTRTTTPFYILAGIFLLVSIMKRGVWRIAGLGITGVILLLGTLFANHGLLNTSGRLQGWRFFMGWWSEFVNPWVGTGGGTFQYLAPLIQMSFPDAPSFNQAWIWLHNDWLQVLFEHGVIGFALIVLVYGWALLRAKRERWVLIGLFAFGFMATAQFPMHWVMTQIWICLLFREAFEPEAGRAFHPKPALARQ